MASKQAWTLQQLADIIGAEVSGDPSCEITGLNTLQNAGSGELAFLANKAYARYLGTTQASAVIIESRYRDDCPVHGLLLDNPYLGYAKLTKVFDLSPVPATGVHSAAYVDPTASLGEGVRIDANATIGANVTLGDGVVVGAGSVVGDDCSIGTGTRLHPNVTINYGTEVGSDCIFHSGSVIAADGFGFAPGAEGWTKIHQLGGVVIGDRVEVGACTTIDRGALDNTEIGNGVILDNQVQVAHNVKIGENTAMAGCSGVAGSTTIGRNCVIAGAVSIIGHLEIVDNVQINVMTLVNRSILEPGSYSSGTVFTPTKSWRKNAVRFNQLDQIAGRVTLLERRVAKAEQEKDTE